MVRRRKQVRKENQGSMLPPVPEVTDKAATTTTPTTEQPRDKNEPYSQAGRKRGRPKGSGKSSSETSEDDELAMKKLKISTLEEKFQSMQNGVVLSLGQGEFGQLGLGENTTMRKKPALVSHDLEGKNIKKVVAGGLHTACLTDDHQVYTFGCNDEGSLGRELADDSEEFEPGVVESLQGIKIIDLSAGDSHTAALSDDGSVYLWGSFRDSHGRLGLVSELEGSKFPVKLQSLKMPIVKIASGCDHVAMMSTSGKIFTLGCAEQGQLGRIARYFSDRGGRRTAKICLRPQAVHLPKIDKIGQKAVDLFCGIYSTYVLTESGSVFAFGLNNYNQLGIPDQENKFSPVYIPVLSGKGWKMFSGGSHHLILLDEKGDVYGLGKGIYGLLGLGKDISNVDEPTKIPGLEDIKLVATGTEVSFAVSKSGKAYAWGMGTNLQLTTGEEDDELSPVELGGKNLEERSVIAVDGGGQHTVILACDKKDLCNGNSS